MKIPQTPPAQEDLWKQFGDHPTLVELFGKVLDSTVNGRYLHWDKLRHLTPPGGLDHLAWWFALKLRRSPGKRIPLLDEHMNNFSFLLVDPMPECLHHVDSLARGAIGQPEKVTTPESRDTYVTRSLIEESITSSQLEGASTTREVAKRMIREGREPRDRSERMIHNNYITMQHIHKIKSLELTKERIFEIHRMITDGTLDTPSGAGRFRSAEERIYIGNEVGDIFHEPPHATQLEWRMAEMCKFANGLSPGGFIHPMVRSMILHFWLAYDHPFVDGNGRTARALFYWSMLRNGYWMFEYITISKIILSGPVKYGKAFLYTESDGNDLTYFLLYHAEIIKRAIDELHNYIEKRSRQLMEASRELRGLTSLNYRQRDLIDHALRHPGHTYTIEYHRSGHNVVYETARADLMDLADKNLLVRKKRGKAWEFAPAVDLEVKLGKNL